MEKNFWTRVSQRRLSRRRALQAGLGVGVGLAAGSVVGCGGSQAPKASTGTDSGTKQPKRGGTFRLHATADPPHLDPFLNDSYRIHSVVGFVLNRLLKYETGPNKKPGDFDPVPDLAEKWEQPDELTYVFKLRQGVKWQNIAPVNGRELTAEDVKWSYDNFTKSKLYEFYWLELDSYQVVDKSTIRFKTKNPSASFLPYVASYFSWIMPKEVYDKWGDGKKNLIGTGPWILDKWEPTVRFVFKRNPDYFEKDLPYIDTVEYLTIPDPSTSLAALRSGDLDIGSVSDAELAGFKADRPDAQYRDYPGIAGYIYWDVNKPPFNDVRVRRAVSMSLDRDGWIKAMFGGVGAWHAIIPTEFDYWHIPIDQLGEGLNYMKYDKEGAKRLLAEAGFPNGFDIDFHSTPGYGTAHVQYVEWIAGKLKEVGIRTTIKMKEYAAYLGSTYRGDFEGMAFGPLRSFCDPDEVVTAFFYPGSILNAQNKTNDPKLTDMILKQRRTLNKEERRKVLWDIDRYVAVQQYLPHRPIGNVHAVYQPWVRNYWEQKGYSREETFVTWIDK